MGLALRDYASRLALPALLLSLVCSPNPYQGTESRTLTLSVAGRMEGFSLARSRSYYEGLFAVLTAEGLTRLDTSGRVLPALATGWTTDRERRTYRFRIRRNIRFHDGTPFSAVDVVRAWEAALREPSGTGLHPWMLDQIVGAAAVTRNGDPLSGMRVIDDSTLEVRLRTPLAIFPRLIAEPQTFISGIAASDALPVGTGPWRWVEGAATAARLVLVRNREYWGDQTRMDSLVIRVLPDTELVRAFASGEVDCTADLTRTSLTALGARTDVRLRTVGPPGVVRLVLDLNHPALADLRVRRALGMALDRRRLATVASASEVVPANGPLPPEVLGSEPERPGMPFDPERSRELLREAGWSQLPRLSLRLPPDEIPEFSPDFYSLLESFWQAVGVQVERVHGADSTHPDIDLRVSYPDGMDPDDYLYSRFHSSVARMGGNPGGFQDRLVDRWLDSGRVVADSAIRALIMRRASERIESLAPNLFLWYVPVTTASTTRINDCVMGGPASTFVETDLASRGPR